MVRVYIGWLFDGIALLFLYLFLSEGCCYARLEGLITAALRWRDNTPPATIFTRAECKSLKGCKKNIKIDF